MSEILYSKITDALVRDGYIVVPNAISSALSQNLCILAKNFQNFKRAGISLHKTINANARRDKILWLDHDNAAQSEFLNFTEGLKEFLNRELFIGLSYFESHFALYEEGDFYEKHYDAFANSKNRVVTVVYYLNENWDVESEGGELVIYDEKDAFVGKVLPESDTLVVFMSEKFPHEVLEAKRERYSIAGWFRVDVKGA
ncbi:MAG TPA: proline hydroxylase [Sulfurimonas sp. UBA12504]|nr:MAG: proline hydroxylase [Sulfurimonas sp. GWF2_37_8]DAB29911.1 MAG TPA: proline hydroxylase [Sulfurimonas sp. UBA12504]